MNMQMQPTVSEQHKKILSSPYRNLEGVMKEIYFPPYTSVMIMLQACIFEELIFVAIEITLRDSMLTDKQFSVFQKLKL